ncbi:methyltransferase domain-containing protein [Vagococcus sp. BWB3-3]|uniref:Methyltransferase domain-containing protein n=1 Tax=Vagococcus allomyrinae TaxID=2794353 RepID=A0A940SQA0_9ENTE|nr:methyltransferase domain-containing protein [Vagococcus allomyrinae]MBP1039492.1 methyltransferase domain-containing protein [Vagococcus allomyrinae]
MKWQSSQYLKFKEERTQPAIDLVARIPNNPFKTIVDLGCGPGNRTHLLGKQFPNSRIIGLDSAPDMIERARLDYPQYQFETCDLADDLTPLGQFDLVFSNACLQWLPNHQELLPRLKKLVAPGGTFAAQLPMNSEQPIHRLIKELATNNQWRPYFQEVRQQHTLTISDYFDLMKENYPQFDSWSTTYFHQLNAHEDIIEWYKGTGLLPYLAQLNDSQIPVFLAELKTQVIQHYPRQKTGTILFPFPRFFMIGTTKTS